MKKFLTLSLWLGILLFLMLGIAEARTDVLIFSGGQEPTIAKMPQFAYLGTRPLTLDDKIIDCVHYKATGEDIYEKVIQYHEKTYLEKGWNPARMRLLVVVKSVNKVFALSGNVNANFSESTGGQKSLYSPQEQIYKQSFSTINSYGSIFPSYNKSWTDQKFTIYFFLVE